MKNRLSPFPLCFNRSGNGGSLFFILHSSLFTLHSSFNKFFTSKPHHQRKMVASTVGREAVADV